MSFNLGPLTPLCQDSRASRKTASSLPLTEESVPEGIPCVTPATFTGKIRIVCRRNQAHSLRCSRKHVTSVSLGKFSNVLGLRWLLRTEKLASLENRLLEDPLMMMKIGCIIMLECKFFSIFMDVDLTIF